MRTRRTGILFATTFVLTALTLSARPVQARGGHMPGLRPDLPNEQTYGTDHFLIHYAPGGSDGVPSEDANSDGAPDYVASVGNALEDAWDVEINQFGWSQPPGDGTLGGDDRIDVYLEDILNDGYAGYSDSEGGYVGDNPRSPESERRAAFSYMGLDNDYAGVEDVGRDETSLELMQTTVAHELNHVIQAGYDGFEQQFWLYESTATWMEDEVHPDINDGVYYLTDVFDEPDICLVAEQGWYANWLLMRLISERYGRDAVRTIWENTRFLDGFAAIDETLAEHGSSLDEAVRDYGVAMLLRDFQEGQLYPAVFVEGTATEGTFNPADGVQGLGVDYVRLSGSGIVEVSLENAQPDMIVRVVVIRGTTADVIDGDGRTLTVDLTGADHAFALIHNNAHTADEDSCQYLGYSLRLSASGGTTTPISETASAVNFGTPVVEADPGSTAPIPEQPFTGGGGEFSSSPTSLNVNFDPVIPTAPPAGYTFDTAYIMTEADFGGSADYYIPGGGESANYDYLDQENNWLSITESLSPYTTLDEWLTDVAYVSPGDRVTISDVDVLLEDLGDASGPWWSATFIYDSLFYVVDGDHDEEAVRTLVSAIITTASGQSAPLVQPTPEPTPAFVPEQPPTLPTESSPISDWGITPEIAALMGGTTCLFCGGGVCLLAGIVALVAILIRRQRRVNS
jgi:hypothetical protein